MNCKKLSKTVVKCCTVLALSALLAACGDDGGTAATTNPPTTNPPTTNPPTTNPPTTGVSFAASIQPIFTAKCVGCHRAGGQASLLVLNSGTYTNLLGADPSVGRPAAAGGGTLVIPGNATNSMLVKRTVGDFDVASNLLRMPLGGPFLSTAEEDLIKTWINEGAKNN